MDDDDKELVRRLMAKATSMLEDAVETAVAGQTSRLSAPEYARAARRLQAAAQDIAVLAETATIVADSSVGRPQNRRKRPS